MSRSIRSGRKLAYKHDGTLPAPWQDFYSLQGGSPHVTIIMEGNRQPGDEDSEAIEGFKVIFVPGDTLTLETARRELARLNGVESQDIMISEENFLQAT